MQLTAQWLVLQNALWKAMPTVTKKIVLKDLLAASNLNAKKSNLYSTRKTRHHYDGGFLHW